MGQIEDPVLRDAFDRIEDTWRNSRTLIESAYCRIDEHSRTILPGGQQKPALVVPLDYDAVVPVTKSRAAYPALVRLFESQLRSMGEACVEVLPMAALCEAPVEPVDDVQPYWNNSYFTGADARLAYGLVRAKKPARIVEIGSGNSTRFFRKAITDGNLPTRLMAIDPSPRLEVEKVADEILRQSVLDVPTEMFAELAPGDIIFFDGSHLCFHGSDVTHFFLRILPVVPSGVLVHVHDIQLPDEYPEHFDGRYYNEQYLLAAFLLNNSEWNATLPVHFLYRKEFLKDDGASFWMMRTGGGKEVPGRVHSHG